MYDTGRFKNHVGIFLIRLDPSLLLSNIPIFLLAASAFQFYT